MLFTGVTRPDIITIGTISTNEKIIACCIVCDMEEIASPVPTVDNVKMKILLAKATPPIFIGIAQTFIVVLFAVFWFDIPLRGSLLRKCLMP